MEKINMDIPGWNTRDILEYLAKTVSELPLNAVILEIGAMFGRTTYVLGHNKPRTAKLITVDPWMTYNFDHFITSTIHDNKCSKESFELIEKYTSKDPDRIEGDDFFKLWQLFVSDIDNLEAVREYSPVKNRPWEEFNFIYHDGPHDEDGVYNDLSFWFPLLKQDGLFVLDDYYPSQFPGLCNAVDRYVVEHDLQTRMITARNIELKRKI